MARPQDIQKGQCTENRREREASGPNVSLATRDLTITTVLEKKGETNATEAAGIPRWGSLHGSGCAVVAAVPQTQQKTRRAVSLDDPVDVAKQTLHQNSTNGQHTAENANALPPHQRQQSY